MAEQPRCPVVVAPALWVVAFPVREALRPVLPGGGPGDELLPHNRRGADVSPFRRGLPAAVPPTATVAATRASNWRHCPPSCSGGKCEADWAAEGHRLLCCARVRGGGQTRAVPPGDGDRNSEACAGDAGQVLPLYPRARTEGGGRQPMKEAAQGKKGPQNTCKPQRSSREPQLADSDTCRGSRSHT